MTSPAGVNREPWHGQSHVRSASFHFTMQPICVQTALRIVKRPWSSRDAAILVPSRETIAPSPRLIDRSERACSPKSRRRQLVHAI
jgi:hypothetical protein